MLSNLVGAFSVIVQPVVEPMEHYTALLHLELSPEVETLRPLEVDQDEAHVNVPGRVRDLARRCDGRVSQLIQ